jgi:hypothetical protein
MRSLIAFASHANCPLGKYPNQLGGLVMIIIRCETGEDVTVGANTLVGVNLSGREQFILVNLQ